MWYLKSHLVEIVPSVILRLLLVVGWGYVCVVVFFDCFYCVVLFVFVGVVFVCVGVVVGVLVVVVGGSRRWCLGCC